MAFTYSVLGTIPLNPPSSLYPTDLELSPDGGKLYAFTGAMYPTSSDMLYEIDTATDTIIYSTSLGYRTESYATTISPDGSKLYFAIYNQTGIGVFDTLTRQVVGTLPSPINESHLFMSPDGNEIYMSEYALNLQTNQFIPLPVDAVQFVFSPDGTKAYGASIESTGVPELVIFDTQTKQVINRITMPDGMFIRDMTVVEDGSKIYLLKSTVDGTHNTISVFDTGTNSLIADIPVEGIYAVHITSLTDGSYAFISNHGGGCCSYPGGGDYISIINMLTEEVTQLVVGDRPFDFAVLPDDSKIYVSDNGVTRDITVIYEPVPEPATMLLLGSGLVGLAGFRKKFRKN